LRSGVRGSEAVLEVGDTGAASSSPLDLAMAERLVLAQGGRLERTAVPGRGAVCRVALPADPDAQRAGSNSFDSPPTRH
jgi:signal transduction histidine kinase